MLKLLKKIFAPPTFEDEEKTHFAQYLSLTLKASFILLIILLISRQYPALVNIVFSLIAIFLIGLHFFIHTKKIELASILFISTIWLGTTYLAWIGAGVRDSVLIIYVILIFFSGSLKNIRISIFLTVLSVASTWLFFFAETKGIFAPSMSPLLANTFSISAIFILIEVILYFTTSNFNKTLLAAEKSKKELLARNNELLQLKDVSQKYASELEDISKKSKEKSIQFATTTEILQKIASIQNEKILLAEITKNISETFGFYHVGIFTIENDKKVAKLQATNSIGGKRMLARNYQVIIDEEKGNCISHVIQNEQHLVVRDLNKNHFCFNHDLPETRSKITLPLKNKEEIIGILDIQSTRKNAFYQEEAEAYVFLANQIAIAIENARQATMMRTALEEARAISRQYTHQTWAQLATTQHHHGYRYAEKEISLLSQEDIITDKENENVFAVQVQIHGETIGVLRVHKDKTMGDFSTADIELIEAVVERTALAMENARLLETTSRRAGREHLVSEITTKIRSTNDPQTMIQIALDELKEALGVNTVELLTPHKNQNR